MIRTTPFFCQTNRRPSGAKAIPTGVNCGSVATTCVVNPGAENVSADAGFSRDPRDRMLAARQTDNAIGVILRRRTLWPLLIGRFEPTRRDRLLAGSASRPNG
jgi:hypothetical protein